MSARTAEPSEVGGDVCHDIGILTRRRPPFRQCPPSGSEDFAPRTVPSRAGSIPSRSRGFGRRKPIREVLASLLGPGWTVLIRGVAPARKSTGPGAGPFPEHWTRWPECTDGESGSTGPVERFFWSVRGARDPLSGRKRRSDDRIRVPSSDGQNRTRTDGS